MQQSLVNVLWIIMIYLIITLLWQLGESLMYGKVTPRFLDDIVALVLATSLLYNIN